MTSELESHACAVSECPFPQKESRLCLLMYRAILPDNAFVPKGWKPPCNCPKPEECIKAFVKLYPELQEC